MRLVGAVEGSKSTSSPSSRPEISLATLGRSEEDPGVELVREKVPLLLFMAIRGVSYSSA